MVQTQCPNCKSYNTKAVKERSELKFWTGLLLLIIFALYMLWTSSGLGVLISVILMVAGITLIGVSYKNKSKYHCCKNCHYSFS